MTFIFAAQRRTVSGGQASPPIITVRNVAGRSSGSIRRKSDGGRSLWVMRCALKNFKSLAPSRRTSSGAMTSAAPDKSAVPISDSEASKLIDR